MRLAKEARPAEAARRAEAANFAAALKYIKLSLILLGLKLDFAAFVASRTRIGILGRLDSMARPTWHSTGA
ncbi:hypothetical protein HAX54_034512 [Datura stramonium]|uniref:Uncharacterized protein n=1 Tax=Datura stramonium TaxID=4076 RepID=A0ABS8SEC6_DATST|nr:hypothetical protein [Datura stramonium]